MFSGDREPELRFLPVTIRASQDVSQATALKPPASESVAGGPRPYFGYATILAAFGGALAATTGLERALGREVRPASTLDLVVLCAGSFKAARSLSRERVGSVLRQPFVDESESADVVHERPAGAGLQRALGELVTCTRCVGTWTAAGLLTCQAIAPRFGHLLTWSLAAGAGNDFLQAAFAALIARELPVERDRL
jgi:hypothetical protein